VKRGGFADGDSGMRGGGMSGGVDG
jgi:hypothetical protein